MPVDMDLEQQTPSTPKGGRPRRYSMFFLGLAAVVLLGLVMLHSVYLAIGIAILSLALLFLGRNYLQKWYENSKTTELSSASVSLDSLGSEKPKVGAHLSSPNGTPGQPHVDSGQQPYSRTPKSDEPSSSTPHSPV